jgi:hypothetical protein
MKGMVYVRPDGFTDVQTSRGGSGWDDVCPLPPAEVDAERVADEPDTLRRVQGTTTRVLASACQAERPSRRRGA